MQVHVFAITIFFMLGTGTFRLDTYYFAGFIFFTYEKLYIYFKIFNFKFFQLATGIVRFLY